MRAPLRVPLSRLRRHLPGDPPDEPVRCPRALPAGPRRHRKAAVHGLSRRPSLRPVKLRPRPLHRRRLLRRLLRLRLNPSHIPNKTLIPNETVASLKRNRSFAITAPLAAPGGRRRLHLVGDGSCPLVVEGSCLWWLRANSWELKPIAKAPAKYLRLAPLLAVISVSALRWRTKRALGLARADRMRTRAQSLLASAVNFLLLFAHKWRRQAKCAIDTLGRVRWPHRHVAWRREPRWELAASAYTRSLTACQCCSEEARGRSGLDRKQRWSLGNRGLTISLLEIQDFAFCPMVLPHRAMLGIPAAPLHYPSRTLRSARRH
jgi:hypothetical protein